MSWLDKLQDTLVDIDNKAFVAPDAEVSMGDNVVGVASEEARKIYTLAMRMRRKALSLTGEIMQKIAEFDERLPEKLVRDLGSRLFQLRAEEQLLMDIFWMSLKDEFNLWKRMSVGIRKGWKVVWNDTPCPHDILDTFFGGHPPP